MTPVVGFFVIAGIVVLCCLILVPFILGAIKGFKEAWIEDKENKK